ncbi:MAG TPA: metal-dependent hydrolase [Polyangiaceae bacterium]|jgi:inner membrane protein|nr:metal-dependent hydrolase [Polyangiaceae bacterium]
MDNVTHALAGLLLADATVLALTPRGVAVDRRFLRRARSASALANNLPDLDFVLRGLTPGRVGYLLHHRGHSHTLPVALALGAIAFGVLARLWRAPLSRERWTLLTLCCLGPWVHIAMDFSNNYGVHPFWPLHDGWFYGDAVFIVEPLFWVLTIPALALASPARAMGFLLWGILLVGLGLAWVTDFADRGTALFLTLVALGFSAVNLRLAPRARTTVAVLGSLAVALLFFAMSHAARVAVAQASLSGTPEHGQRLELVDTSLAPAPSNPFCWSAMSVGQQSGRYVLLVATVALVPSLISLERCAVEPTGRSLALHLPELESTPRVRWDGEWTAPLTELGALFRGDCEARAYLRWARLPFWFAPRRGTLFLGDIRYDRDRGLDFAETVGTSPPRTCPKRVPPWTPPRGDLMNPPVGP